MAENKSKLSGPLGIPVVLLVEIIIFVWVMAIYLVEGGWILIAEVVLAVLLIFVMKKVPSVERR